jgi:ABC-2 type transport system permease protein
MRTILLVIKHEIVTMLGKRSFWIMTFLFPLLIMVLTFGSQFMADRAIAEEEPPVGIPLPGAGQGENGEPGSSNTPTTASANGYVDQSGLIQRHPAEIPYERLHPFADEAAAQTALTHGEISRYYLIPPDYLRDGKIMVIEKEFQPFASLRGGATPLMTYLINLNLTEDSTTALLLSNPTASVNARSIAPQPEDEGDPMAFVAAFTPTMFIFFFLLINSSGFMLQSVSREKENRTVEMLLVSLRPRELMMGKMAGLSVIALLQMSVWIGGSMLVLGRSSGASGIASLIVLPEGFLIWAVLFFILGYLVYASLMGAVGALAPTAREGGQLVFIIILPLMIPLWFNAAFIQAPNGGAATFLSLFPMTAPTSMITRMMMVAVPPWQMAVSMGGLAVTAYLFILLSARFFRADTLLSGAAVSWRRIWLALKPGA